MGACRSPEQRLRRTCRGCQGSGTTRCRARSASFATRAEVTDAAPATLDRITGAAGGAGDELHRLGGLGLFRTAKRLAAEGLPQSGEGRVGMGIERLPARGLAGCLIGCGVRRTRRRSPTVYPAWGRRARLVALALFEGGAVDVSTFYALFSAACFTLVDCGGAWCNATLAGSVTRCSAARSAGSTWLSCSQP